jgi:D-arginine dehydrogenase
MDVDVAIVGGGIAGVSVAGELASDEGLRVAVLEQENQLAYHATGRSAAAYLESYGSPEIRVLTRASRSVLAEADLLHPRPILWVAPKEHAREMADMLAREPRLRAVTGEQARELCSALRPGWTSAAAVEDGAQDLDVAGLFERYRRRAVVGGVSVLTAARIELGEATGGRWLLRTSSGDVRAGIVVNAAGAWADEVARRCGVEPIGLTPFRRTVAIVSADVDRNWPLVGDVAEGFYFRPEGNGLLLSPADETPTEPCDARPDTVDVALALERANDATTLNLRHVSGSWAGLRTFAPDRNPVVGSDPAYPGFVWLAGQGGYGMQTAPAMAVLAAALIRGAEPPGELSEFVDRLSPVRLRGPEKVRESVTPAS